MAKKGKLKGRAKTEEPSRPERERKYKYLFLIVCEDEKTEPAYFERFKSKIPPGTLYLKPVGTGRDPKGVVEQAIYERQALKNKARKEVDCVWVVFDKDDAHENLTKVARFQEAFRIADAESFKVAYSNEVFELWLLLHFKAVSPDRALPRKEVYELLRSEFKKVVGHEDYEYDHSQIDSRTIEIVWTAGRQDQAIAQAKRLSAYHDQQKHQPIQANPSTQVHLLVEELLSWIAFYAYVPK
jgi:hypothetical protein